ncbi:MAG: twin-arginine translocation signal domain-containing protein, partial [Puniceicoccaceae bacterium]
MKNQSQKLTRRDFIARSSMAAGLALSAPAILSGKQALGGVPSGEEIRVAFIGCGRQQEVLFHAMANLP